MVSNLKSLRKYKEELIQELIDINSKFVNDTKVTDLSQKFNKSLIFNSHLLIKTI